MPISRSIITHYTEFVSLNAMEPPLLVKLFLYSDSQLSSAGGLPRVINLGLKPQNITQVFNKPERNYIVRVGCCTEQTSERNSAQCEKVLRICCKSCRWKESEETSVSSSLGKLCAGGFVINKSNKLVESGRSTWMLTMYHLPHLMVMLCVPRGYKSYRMQMIGNWR